MTPPLSPALAVIFIQYAKGALPQPYTDFERFEIFMTLIEELDPYEPYEAHRQRVEKDSRSAVIESDTIRMELYERWAAAAYMARRRDNKEWNSFIAFVNAQLKFHVDLSYEQFRFLCDEMAGFRLNSLPEEKKRSLFWGCVLRRERRFAHIQEIIDSRERMEQFVGPIEMPDKTTDYAGRIGVGLDLPVVPSCNENALEVAHSVRGPSWDAEEVWPNGQAEAAFVHAEDVMQLSMQVQTLEDKYANGELDEQSLSSCILRLCMTIKSPSEPMKSFGRNIQSNLDNLEEEVPEKSACLYDALLSLSLSAQGFVKYEANEAESGAIESAQPDGTRCLKMSTDKSFKRKDAAREVKADVGNETFASPRSAVAITKDTSLWGFKNENREPLHPVSPEAVSTTEAAKPQTPPPTRPASPVLKPAEAGADEGTGGSSPQNSTRTVLSAGSTADSNANRSHSEKRQLAVASIEVGNNEAARDEEASYEAGIEAPSMETARIEARCMETARIEAVNTEAANTEATNTETCSTTGAIPTRLAEPAAEGAKPLESPRDDDFTEIPVFFGHALEGPNGVIFLEGPLDLASYNVGSVHESSAESTF